MRRSKRELCALQSAIDAAPDAETKAVLEAEYRRSAARLGRQRRELEDFLAETGRARRADREQAVGFGRSEASKAAAVARKLRAFDSLVGTRAAGGLAISGVSKHFGERALERSVTLEEVLKSLTSPLQISNIKTDSAGRISQEYIGDRARTTVNPSTGNLVTTWKTGSRLRKKLKGGKDE